MTLQDLCTYGFRSVGLTHFAVLTPHTEAGLSIAAQHSGVPVEKLPPAFRYASNVYMRDWFDRLGRAQMAGHIVRDPDRRWLTNERLDALN